MATKKRKSKKQKVKTITKVGATCDSLVDRAGLAPFVNFLRGSKVHLQLESDLSDLRRSKKGIALDEAFLQTLTFLGDGSSQHLAGFDELKEDTSLKKMLGVQEMISTPQVKRLLAKADEAHFPAIRSLIQRTALTALKSANPDAVIFFLDSTVYDNNDAICRGGCKPTYKKVLGYHPQNLVWNGMIFDTIFRRGDHHSNHGDEAIRLISDATKKVRGLLGKGTPIIFLMDSGYYDQKNFDVCDKLGVGFVCSGKRHSGLKVLQEIPSNELEGSFQNNTSCWKYAEYIEERQSWSKNYRAYYLRIFEADGERQLGLDDRTIVSNIREEGPVGKLLIKAGREDLLKGEGLIRLDHSRGKGELTFRSIKEFHDEKMPCLDFLSNSLWYYLGVLAFNLFQNFKRRVASHLFSENAYPNTVRRKLFDIAGKICASGHTLTLKLTRFNMKRLSFEALWEKSLIPFTLVTL